MILTELAEAVNVAEEDLRVILGWMDLGEGDDVSDDVITVVHSYLNRHCERTVPELYWGDLPTTWRAD